MELHMLTFIEQCSGLQGRRRCLAAGVLDIWHGTDPPDLGTARHGTSLPTGCEATVEGGPGNLGVMLPGVTLEVRDRNTHYSQEEEVAARALLSQNAFERAFKDGKQTRRT